MQIPVWKDLIAELRARGFTLQEIGDRAGLTMSSVHDLYTGRSKEPSGGPALLLYFLHRHHVRGAPSPRKEPREAQG